MTPITNTFDQWDEFWAMVEEFIERAARTKATGKSREHYASKRVELYKELGVAEFIRRDPAIAAKVCGELGIQPTVASVTEFCERMDFDTFDPDHTDKPIREGFLMARVKAASRDDALFLGPSWAEIAMRVGDGEWALFENANGKDRYRHQRASAAKGA